MSSRSPIRLPQTVVFRLTLWYAAVFALSACSAFAFMYVEMQTNLDTIADKELVEEATKYADLFGTQGIEGVQKKTLKETHYHGSKKVFFRILDASGNILASSETETWREIGVAGHFPDRISKGSPFLETVTMPSDGQRVRVLYGLLGPQTFSQMGQSLDVVTVLMESLQTIFLVCLAVPMLLATFVGWFMARRAISGVDTITHTAIKIAKLAIKGKVLGRRALSRLACIVTPDTILRWHRELVAKSPNLNAQIERYMRSLKYECLNSLVFFGEKSLRRALSEFTTHYHQERNHQGLGNDVIDPGEKAGRTMGEIQYRERLGGMLGYYYREAA